MTGGQKMSVEEQACYTFEGAIEVAVQMEQEGFRHFLDILRKAKNKQTKEILKDVAIQKLEDKHKLEKALAIGYVEGEEHMDRPFPTMNLDYVLKAEEPKSDLDPREALAHAIHMEKGSLDFYQRTVQTCTGAPMASLFEHLVNDKTKHLQILEDLYEKLFLPQM
jgi:rubrerythrin